MEKSVSLKGKIIAIIFSAVAALLAVALVLVIVLYPPSDAFISSSGIQGVVSDIESTPQNIVSSDNTVVSSQESSDTSSETVTTPQNVPSDLESISPMKSKHEVPEDATDFNITLSFLGDMILASNNYDQSAGSFNSYAASHDPSYFLEKVRPVLEADDFTIANVENVFTDRQLTPVYKDYSPAFWFGSKASNINILSNAGVEGAMIANNHIRDYGTEGYNDSVQAITGAGMVYGDASRIMYFEKGGYVIAVVSSGMWGEYQANNIVNLIKEAEQHSHYQVVIFHGGTEKIHEPEEWKRRAARKLVDNGADLVVGGHPHVLQPREVYNGVEIVYSIGNFCYGGHRKPENRTVIYQMSLTINKQDLTLKSSASNIMPCYVFTGTVNNFQPAIIEDGDPIKQRILDFMDGKISSPV